MRKKGILALAVALTCLLSVSGTTYAYLKHTTEAKVAGIQSAEYALQIEGVFYAAQAVTVSDDSGEPGAESSGTGASGEEVSGAEAVKETLTGKEIYLDNNSYQFTEPGTAVFTLTASGTANGYCIVKVVGESGTDSEAVYYTEMIAAEDEADAEGYTVSIAATAGTKAELIPYWGIYSVTEERTILKSGEILDFTENVPAAVSDVEITTDTETVKETEETSETESAAGTGETSGTGSTTGSDETLGSGSTTGTEETSGSESTTGTEETSGSESTTGTVETSGSGSTTETDRTTEGEFTTEPTTEVEATSESETTPEP